MCGEQATDSAGIDLAWCMSVFYVVNDENKNCDNNKLFMKAICMALNSKKNEKKRSERRKRCALAIVRWNQKFSPRGRRTVKI